MDLSELRKEYRMRTLDLTDLNLDPHDQMEKWFQEALKTESEEPYAAQLATVDSNARPSCRTVLIRRIDPKGFYFFTNYESRKGRELLANPQACLLFCWKSIERQVVIEGVVERSSQDISHEYFSRRPRKSQISALASLQSRPLANREIMEEECGRIDKLYQGEPIPCPENWGGFILKPTRYEFWQGRESRMHDRFEYLKNGEGWEIRRLWP